MFHRFVVTQGEGSRACLEDLQRFFEVGRIFVNRRHDNHREHLCQYHVSRREDLLETIIPFFQKYPLRTSKQMDFEAFSRCMEIVATGRHLTRAGLVDIAEIAQTMNHQKPRHELIRILRDHTPETLDRGP